MRLIAGVLLLSATSSALFEGKSKEQKQCEKDGTCDTKPRDVSEMWIAPKEAEDSKKGLYFDNNLYAGRVAQSVIERLSQKPRVIDEKCSKVSGICYQVVDKVWVDEEGYSHNPWEMLRIIQVKGDESAHFGRAMLIKPTKLNWKTFDTKTWKVNKYAIIDRELQTMIGGLTGSKAVAKNEGNATKIYEILIAGLGAPVIPNFIEQYYWMSMTIVEKEPIFTYFAKKYFEFVEGPAIKVVHADPISFVAEARKKGTKYDGVMINLCKTKKDILQCPTDEYLERSTIQLLRSIVLPKGVLTVNSRAVDKTQARTVANTYDGVFPMCFDYPEDHKQLTIERYKGTVCFNREALPFWKDQENRGDYIYHAAHSWFFTV